MQGTAITLIKVVGAIHQAIKEDAMLDTGHVRGLMRENFTASTQHKRLPIRPILSVKLRIVTGETKYAAIRTS
jgi:hypothetical protein